MEPIVKAGDPLTPVAAITSGPLASAGAVLIRFDFLSHAMQDLAQAHPGRNYVLMPAQARYLIQQIAAALVTLESAASTSPPGPAH